MTRAIENWGATEAERDARFPCDALLPGADVALLRAVDVEAPAATTFRWLCQLRVAPYSYDLLDNLGRTSPRELTPGLEHLQAGQRFMTIFALDSFAPGEHITLRARRTAVTYAVLPRGGSARLLVRVLFAAPGPQASASLFARALALGDLVMMRRQLRTLKKLSERDASPRRS
jgi:hypothetical protein